jgi:hypothetical protein
LQPRRKVKMRWSSAACTNKSIVPLNQIKANITLGQSTPRETATQPQFPRIVTSMSWTHVTEWSSANWRDGNATHGKTEEFNFQATEYASLLTLALPRGFLLSAVLHV